MKDRHIYYIGISLVMTIGLAYANAEKTRFYHLEGFGHFLDGNPETTAVTEKGGVRIGPISRKIAVMPSTNIVEAVWWRDKAYLADAENSKIFTIDEAGNTDYVAQFEDQVITSMAFWNNSIVVATGPGATIYQISKRNKKSELVKLQEDYTYIWKMKEDRDGNLIAATGDPGHLISISKRGKVKVLFESPQRHLSALYHDKNFGYIVGGGEKATVYNGTTKENFKALLSTGHKEITGFTINNNHLYVSAVTGSAKLLSRRKGDSVEVRSQLYRVDIDGYYESIAGSNDEIILDVSNASDGKIMVSTGAARKNDPRGRVYSINDTPRIINMYYQSKSERIIRMLSLSKDRWLLVSGGGGRLDIITKKPAKHGVFYTSVFDTGIISKIGRIEIGAELPKNTSVDVQVRTGQSQDPDDGWNNWSKPIAFPGGQTHVPAGRYLQAKLNLYGNAKLTPEIYRLKLAYHRKNIAPIVEEVGVLMPGIYLQPVAGDEDIEKQSGDKNIQVSLKKLRELADYQKDEAKLKSQNYKAIKKHRPGALTIYWRSHDINGDRLNHTLSYKRVGEDMWQVLQGEITVPFYPLERGRFSDGRYYFKVDSSDALDNSKEDTLQASGVSRVIEIDNSAPVISSIKVKKSRSKVELQFSVTDSFSIIEQVSYALDGQYPVEIIPDDGMYDGEKEFFTIVLHDVKKQSHMVTITALDNNNNHSYKQISFKK